MALTDKLTAIADAIRGKTGGTEGMTLDAMVSAIEGIEAGGGGSATSEITITMDINSPVEFNPYWNAIGETGTCLYVRNGWENGFSTVDGIYWVLFISGNVRFAIRRYNGSLSFPNLAGGSTVKAIIPAGAVFTRLEFPE